MYRTIKSRNRNSLTFLSLAFFVGSLLFVGLLHQTKQVSALDNNLTNGITVDSVLDTADASVGDGICDDGDGNCTLRAAIEEANSDPDSSTIGFNLSGPPSFSNNSQNGYTIQITQPLPTIATTVTIDGYTQSGSQVNDAVWPNPLNGVLLVEIDGSLEANIGVDHCLAIDGADSVILEGLVIGNCAADGIHVTNSQHTNIMGNYIGVDYTGIAPWRNGRDATDNAQGSGIYLTGVSHTTIGSTDPADRNVIAGNQFGDIWSESSYKGNDESQPLTNSYTTVQGNYLGLGSDGTTVIPSGYGIGHGNSILMTHSGNDLIGGTTTGAGNVIASSLEFGVSFRGGSRDGVIQGNYIGTDYTGLSAARHPDGSLDCDPNVSNPCGSYGNPNSGVSIATISNGGYQLPSHGFLIGGSTPNSRNIISGNKYRIGQYADGIVLHDQTYDVRVQNNYIGTGIDGITSVPNSDGGIQIGGGDLPSVQPTIGILIGGDTDAEANLIANNGSDGVQLFDSDTKTSILGNAIYSNSGRGIALGSYRTPNDSLDPDVGPNNFLNTPEYSTPVESSGNTTVNYTLDVPAGSYRIEFFSNTTADPSGYGEGETYLGFQNVTSNGTGAQSFSKVLVNVTGVTNLAMTTTKIDGSTPYGFGATSEFGGHRGYPVDVSVSKELSDPQDVAKGATIHYNLTLTQEGYSTVDLSQLDGSGFNPFQTSLFIDFLPPELNYVASSNPDISCIDTGSGLASALAINHTDWHVILCVYSGAGQILSEGESISTSLEVTVNSDSDLTFDNYALSPLISGDPDVDYVGGALGVSFGGGGDPDFIDIMISASLNNFAYASYSPSGDSTPDPSSPNPVDSSSGSKSGLSSTGQNIVILLVTGLSLVVASVSLSVYKKRS